jgi:hypothetical protein
MLKFKTTIFLFVSGVMLSSCATLFNSKYTTVTVHSEKPRQLVVNTDTLERISNIHEISVLRDKAPLNLTFVDDSLSKSISIPSQNSAAYWLNLYPSVPLFLGFYIDTKTKRRYTYPKNIYMDLNNPENTYLSNFSLDSSEIIHPNFLKVTPLKILGTFNPSIELSYGRRTGKHYYSEISLGYILPESYSYSDPIIKPEMKGFTLGLEEKYFYNISGPVSNYVGFECAYLNNQFKDVWTFEKAKKYLDSNYISYQDTIGIKKQTIRFNFKVGRQYVYESLVIDIYAGLGLRFKDVRHYDKLNSNDNMYRPRHPNIFYIVSREGKYWTLSLPLNVKIGWNF